MMVIMHGQWCNVASTKLHSTWPVEETHFT
jgi:hypothetical protein